MATKAAPGWYPDSKRPGEMRRWDGAAWLDEWKPMSTDDSPGPWAYIGWGFLLVASGLLFGVVLFVVDARDAAIIVASIFGGVASVILTIGVIAKAVEVGVRAAKR